jgi:peptidoglycan/xylan/chitin deacetylase (PgdA/CDA1 family)
VLATGLGGWGVVGGWRMVLLADAGFLIVRNHLRTYRLNWHDVAEFSDGRMSVGEGGVRWALRILLNDGSAVTSQATSRVRAARPSTAEAIAEIARQHGITESLTGRPARRARRPRDHP